MSAIEGLDFGDAAENEIMFSHKDGYIRSIDERLKNVREYGFRNETFVRTSTNVDGLVGLETLFQFGGAKVR